MDSNTTAKELIKRAEELKSSRSNLETEWDECAKYFRPIKHIKSNNQGGLRNG